MDRICFSARVKGRPRMIDAGAKFFVRWDSTDGPSRSMRVEGEIPVNDACTIEAGAEYVVLMIRVAGAGTPDDPCADCEKRACCALKQALGTP